MNILFVQLPVPTLVPVRNVGNHLLASSSIVNHLKNTSAFSDNIDVLPQQFCTRAGDSQIIELIDEKQPDVIAFTCTVWNIERTLYIAEKIKNTLSNVKIWLGGPEIAGDSYFINDKNSIYDLAVEGEGEEIFRLLLSGIDPTHIDRVYTPYKKSEETKLTPLIADLHTIHDPFINGFATMEEDNVAVAEFFRGCRYGCRFCKYHNGFKQSALRPYSQIKELFDWYHKKGVQELFLLDPSFEQRPDIVQFLSFLSEVNSNPSIPIFAELRAEYVDTEFAQYLYKAGIRQIETGLQTLTPEALRIVRRAFNKDKFTSGISALKKTGIKIRTDVMYGLPGDTPDQFNRTLSYLKENDLSSDAQIFRTQVLPGTELRKHSNELGISFEPRPPYQILSTPTWSESELSSATENIESALDICSQPEERPLIITEDDQHKPYKKCSFSGTSIVYGYFFDCTSENGCKCISQENFSQAALTTSLHIKIDSLNSCEIIKMAILRHLRNNPFSSTVIALQLPSQFPLDILDEVSPVLENFIYSNYLQSIFSATYSNLPNRRLMTCLEMSKQETYSKSWLEEIRNLSEIVWIYNYSGVHSFHEITNFRLLEPVDYCLLNINNSTFSADQFSILSQSKIAEQIIFSDLKTQWDFIDSFD